MDAATLITNLLDAIDDALAGRVDDAKETAQLARMVLPTISAPAAAPVGDHVVINEDEDRVYGPMTGADASALENQMQAASEGATTYHLAPATTWHGGVSPQPAPPGRHPQPAPAPQPAQPPQGVPALCSCGASNDYNGNCTDPNCPDGNYVPSNAATRAGCPDCGDPLNASGTCDNCGWHPSGPGFPTAPIKAQTFDEVMADVHTAAERHRPGSVISNKPRGSLYT